MLFTPNDFNSSSAVSISGICHSIPHVWHETVMPLENGKGSNVPATGEVAAVTINNPQSENAAGKNDRFIGVTAQFSCETVEHKGELWSRRKTTNERE